MYMGSSPFTLNGISFMEVTRIELFKLQNKFKDVFVYIKVKDFNAFY